MSADEHEPGREPEPDPWEGASVVEGERDTPAADDGGVECPECGARLKNRKSLGGHMRDVHKIKGGIGGRGPGRPRKDGNPSRPPSGNRQERRRRLVQETLIELSEFTDELRGRSELPAVDLSDLIRRDAAKIANSVAWVAERFNPLGTLIDLTTGHGGAITIMRGFTGVGGWVLRRWRTLLSEREREQAQPGALYADQLGPEGEGLPTVDEHGNLIDYSGGVYVGNTAPPSV